MTTDSPDAPVPLRTSQLLQAAAAAAGAQHYPQPALYVVGTPIGNLADLSLRAAHTLALADAVACEDTRVAAVLLRHLGLTKPLMALHAHNERDATARVLERLQAGARVAYVSDAGTPAISDPGAVLVDAVRAAGLRVVPIPGPSSAAVALSVAGDGAGAERGGAFLFTGFLPVKGAQRQAALQQAAAQPYSTVLFEAPHRIEALAAALADACPARTATLCRELTKQYETVHTLACSDLPAWLAADAQRLRGEFVLVLHALPATAQTDDPAAVEGERLLRVLLRDLPLKQAVALAAELSGAPRNALYQQALALKAGAADEADEGR